MERTLAAQTLEKIGETITLKGWVNTKRDHGKVTFIDLRDRSGVVQLVGYKKMREFGPEDVIEVVGVVKQREQINVNPNSKLGTIEVDVAEYKLLAKARSLPFDMGKEELDLELPTLLDHRALTLRHPKVQAIFKVQAVIIDAFREYLKGEGFMEFQAPVITPAVAEGGADVFKVNYFDQPAYLTQSPQLYKQIVMSAFERVFSVNKIFRAEPSVTTRHITEIVSLDAELGFIESWTDVRDVADQVIKYIFNRLEKECRAELDMFGATVPAVIPATPSLSLREVQEKIFKHSGRDVRNEKDLNPEDEREICQIIKDETGSDLVFVYGFPTKQKPFYVYPNPDNPEFNEGMDLLCRGLELLSGGRRINDYEQLTRHAAEWKMDPDKIRMFLDAFSYGVPPEGGFAFGAERITMQILGLKNVREANMFPRDMDRIDFRLKTNPKPAVVAAQKKSGSVFDQIVDRLDQLEIKYQVLEHQSVTTSEEASQIRGTSLEQGAKALVMLADKNPIMVVIAGHLKADLKQLKKLLEVKDLSMAPRDLVEKITQVEIGAVPPLGSLFNLPTYLDETLAENKQISFNAGKRDKSIKMQYQDLLKLERPTVASFAKK